MKFSFLLRGNQATSIVDGASDERVAGVEGALWLDVDDEGDRLVGCRQRRVKENVEYNRPFRWAAVLIARSLNLFRLVFGRSLNGVRQVWVNGNFPDVDD